MNVDTEDGGELVRRAALPTAVLSKMALAKGVGVFGLCVLAGFGIALLVDRRDSLGGGRRRVQQLLPGANIRILPTAGNRKASPAEIDAAIDRLAVDLVSGGTRGRAASVLVVGTRVEPPLALAEELASSLTFAGIPALFVLAGSSDRDLRQAQVVTSFTDLITGPSITGPASLPAEAGAVSVSAPTVTWLRPRGSAEASGLLRRAVVEALITRAGREGFEAVVFVAATPTLNAAGAALGQWVAKTSVVVEDDDGAGGGGHGRGAPARRRPHLRGRLDVTTVGEPGVAPVDPDPPTRRTARVRTLRPPAPPGRCGPSRRACR